MNVNPMWVILAVASGWGAILAWFILFNGLPWDRRIAGSLGFGVIVAVLCSGLLVWLTNGAILRR